MFLTLRRLGHCTQFYSERKYRIYRSKTESDIREKSMVSCTLEALERNFKKKLLKSLVRKVTVQAML